MISIIKEKNQMGSLDIRLQIEENITLDVVFGGVGDVFWIYDNQNFFDVKEDPMYDKLLITKEDTDIYNIFNELYEDLINCRIYIPDKCGFIEGWNEQDEKRCRLANERIKTEPRYNKLVKDGVITWYSDEEYESIAEIVRISKQDDNIVIEFIRQSTIDELGGHRLPGWYSIRFRMDGCTYEPCNVVFWRHFDNLQKYEPKENKKLERTK